MFKDYKKLLKIYSNDSMRRNLDRLSEHELVNQVGGEQLDCIHINIRIENFSTHSESFTAFQLMEFLTAYCTAVFDLTYRSGAFVNTIEGTDCEIVFFVDSDNTTNKAIALLFEIQLKIEDLLRRKYEKISPEAFIGSVFSGQTVFYNIGTRDRMFTQSMGNAKNFAYRLLGINKNYGTRILVTESERFESTEYEWRMLDRVRVVGAVGDLWLIEPVLVRGRQQFSEMIRLFNLGTEAQTSKNWSLALEFYSQALKENPNDKPSLIMQKRCEKYLTNEPNRDWDGKYNITE